MFQLPSIQNLQNFIDQRSLVWSCDATKRLNITVSIGTVSASLSAD